VEKGYLAAKDRPRWLAIGLASPSLVLMVFFKVSEVLGWTFLRPEVAATGSSDQDRILIVVQLLSGLAGGIVALIALVGGHERSWLVGLAMVPGLLFFFSEVLIWPFTSLLIGKNADPVVTYSLSVLISVLIVAVTAFWIGKGELREVVIIPEGR